MPAQKSKYISSFGIIGAGSFGIAVANLLALNVRVLIYARKEEVVDQINRDHHLMGYQIHPSIQATNDLEDIAKQCYTLLPIIPSGQFRSMMRNLGPFLTPAHILIHGTKGLDVEIPLSDEEALSKIKPRHVHTMSQVIRQESIVRRVGCLAGPNLASEIVEGQPTATVVASPYREVVQLGKDILGSPNFRVYGNDDLIGAELAGALKNIIAIGSGILSGKGLGKNIQAMLISRGLIEMIHFGKAFGTSVSAFFGTAGVGDLIATATSDKSRNFSLGLRLGRGESIEEIKSSMPELAEGLRTLKISHALTQSIKLRSPITSMLHQVVYHDYDIDEAIRQLLTYPYDVDVDFL